MPIFLLDAQSSSGKRQWFSPTVNSAKNRSELREEWTSHEMETIWNYLKKLWGLPQRSKCKWRFLGRSSDFDRTPSRLSSQTEITEFLIIAIYPRVGEWERSQLPPRYQFRGTKLNSIRLNQIHSSAYVCSNCWMFWNKRHLTFRKCTTTMTLRCSVSTIHD